QTNSTQPVENSTPAQEQTPQQNNTPNITTIKSQPSSFPGMQSGSEYLKGYSRNFIIFVENNRLKALIRKDLPNVNDDHPFSQIDNQKEENFLRMLHHFASENLADTILKTYRSYIDPVGL